MLKATINQQTQVLLSCFASSVEQEEVAALLLGSVHDSIVVVKSACLLPRREKKKDRVDVGDQELARGLEMAESLGLQVVGWFHSHPHITISPSHVDLRTQLQLQLLDKSFLGLIYGSFHRNPSGSQRIQTIAFQACMNNAGVIEQVNVPLDVQWDDHGSDTSDRSRLDFLKSVNLHQIPETFLQEELMAGVPESATTALYSAARMSKINSSLLLPILRLLKQR